MRPERERQEVKGEETFEEQEALNHAYNVGRSAGLEEAGNLLMERAVESFKKGNDWKEADLLRALAAMLIQRGKDTHPGVSK